MCDEGRVGYHRVQGEGRLQSPLVRRGEDFHVVPWQEALETVATRLGEIRKDAGEGAIGARGVGVRDQ